MTTTTKLTLLPQAIELGKVASYIPQLAKYDASNWAMSICTVDGQRFSLGPVKTMFTMQSCSKVGSNPN